ncbi:MAG: hypothetical protein JWM74_2241 [Myxococcaceae bacterium]|nr:hypothetical protein [Myxococcaceae bacterium]
MALPLIVAVVLAFGPPLAGCGDAATDGGAIDAGADHDHDHLQLEPEDGSVAATGPLLLSETGLYSDFAARTVAPDVQAFAPRYEFWVDGAKKSRWLWLPPGTKIDDTAIDHFVFPIGTKAWKEFVVDGKVVETRLLMKVRDGDTFGWWQAAYVWKDDGSDAVEQLDGVTNAMGTTHDVPKQSDCFNCHGNVKDTLIGVSAIQLGDPAQTPRPIDAFDARGWLKSPPPANLDVPGTGAVKDGLAYLHANCGHCHNDEAVRLKTQTPMRLRLLVGQRPEDTGALTTTIGTVMKHPLPNDVTRVVVAGEPDKSGLYIRMGLLDGYRMPPIGSKTPDDVGREAVRQLILGMK